MPGLPQYSFPVSTSRTPQPVLWLVLVEQVTVRVTRHELPPRYQPPFPSKADQNHTLLSSRTSPPAPATIITAFAITHQRHSPMPFGRTPGHLFKAIRRFDKRARRQNFPRHRGVCNSPCQASNSITETFTMCTVSEQSILPCGWITPTWASTTATCDRRVPTWRVPVTHDVCTSYIQVDHGRLRIWQERRLWHSFISWLRMFQT